MVKFKKLFKIFASISIILTIFFKIRDIVRVKGLACGLKPVKCSMLQFLYQVLVWFLVFIAALLIIWYGGKWLIKTFKNRKKEKTKVVKATIKEKEEAKEAPKEKIKI